MGESAASASDTRVGKNRRQDLATASPDEKRERTQKKVIYFAEKSPSIEGKNWNPLRSLQIHWDPQVRVLAYEKVQEG